MSNLTAANSWPVRTSIAIPTFAVTLFVSASLMFFVEPMVAKMVLPKLGGAAAVWTTCLVFFQATLLLGYAYAHLLTRLSRSAQIIVHICVLLPLATTVLPLSLGADAPSAEQSPVLWLLLRLTLTCGIPVFVISTTAPLLQHWFADGSHKQARDPYFLYALSNAGSLLALLAYPLLIEPELTLDRQSWLWSAGFAALAFGLVACAAIMLSQRRTADAPKPTAEAAATAGTRDRLRWTALAFIPSSLLLGVTQYITTDVVSAPLLWVIPLTLYLLTFILTFARRPPLPHAATLRALPIMLILVAMTSGTSGNLLPLPIALAFHLGCFFVVGIVCHGELAKRRPPAAQLTEFYFFLSLGGVLGGVFNALIAPLIFNGVWEYPLVLVAACLMRPRMVSDARRGLPMDLALPLLLSAALMIGQHALTSLGSGPAAVTLLYALYVLPALALVNFSKRRLRFALAVAVLLFMPVMPQSTGQQIVAKRSFFGVYRVEQLSDAGTPTLVLMSGTTMHGAKSMLPNESMLPMTYYSPEGPFGRFIRALPQGATRRFAVIGLGSGALACYAEAGQSWTFYEIDPTVERLASEYFQFLEKCAPGSHVVLGDARMTITNAPDGSYDVLVVDAFSSDSIPMHLLTREALTLYQRKLAPGGRLLFHISSRKLDLALVVGALAADAGLPARTLFDVPPPGTSTFRRAATQVAVVAKHDGDLGFLSKEDGWEALPTAPSQYLWTDQRADLLRVIRF
ncbi:spermidine synthase [Bradyrhizobium brasilense]|uniref:spermidine synthase n=1 Tax=Bradyrhizobium brasilense TaxID=1419277 RepID=UPI00117744DB|nr:fused MFS/spermidine synthase [Bradyrhizobium brasilense]